jgi:hypothetical protein
MRPANQGNKVDGPDKSLHKLTERPRSWSKYSNAKAIYAYSTSIAWNNDEGNGIL